MSNSETSPDERFEQEGSRIETGRLAPGRAAMWLLAKSLRRLVQNGRLTIYDPCGQTWHFGPGGEPAVSVRLTEKVLPVQLLVNPSIALGEAYMDGTLRIETGSLRDLLSICMT